MRLKDIAHINRHVLPETTDPDYSFHYIDIGSVDGYGRVRPPDEPIRFGEAPSRARRVVPARSTVISTVRTYLRSVARVPYSVCPLVFSTGFAVLESKMGVDDRFLAYLCRSDEFIAQVVARSVGVGYPAINPGDLASIPVNLPSSEDQCRIADFLDVETAQIDAISAIRERARRSLPERRFSTVYSLVTGLDRTGPRVDPGLGWTRSLPSNWSVVRLTHVARLGSGHTPSRTHPEYWQDCSIPWISLFDVGRMRDVRQIRMQRTVQRISELGIANSSACLHPAETVVLSRTASVGFSTIMDVDMAVSQHFATWTCGGTLLPEYLLQTLRAMRQYFESVQVGTTNVTVFMPDLQSIKIPLPPLEEQQSIVERIYANTDEVDSLADQIDRQISLLAERRQALITAAVTGQIDVTTPRGVDV